MCYYLSSSEYEDCLGIPIKIIPKEIIKLKGIDENNNITNEYLNTLKVQLKKPFKCNKVITEELKKILHNNKIEFFYLITRHVGVDFYDISKIKCPTHVHVFLPKEINKEPNSINDLCHAWWAVIYDNYEDARIHKFG